MSRGNKRRKQLKQIKHKLKIEHKNRVHTLAEDELKTIIDNIYKYADILMDISIITKELELVNNLPLFDEVEVYNRLIYYKPIQELNYRKRKIYDEIEYEPVIELDFHRVELKDDKYEQLCEYYYDNYDIPVEMLNTEWSAQELETLKIRLNVEVVEHYFNDQQFVENYNAALVFSDESRSCYELLKDVLYEQMDNAHNPAYVIKHVKLAFKDSFRKVFYDSDQYQRDIAVKDAGAKIYDELPDKELFDL